VCVLQCVECSSEQNLKSQRATKLLHEIILKLIFENLCLGRSHPSSVLQWVAVCCSGLQCVAVCYSVLQCVAVCCSVLQCVAVYSSVLQYVAVSSCVFQCVSVCCSVLQSEFVPGPVTPLRV